MDITYTFNVYNNLFSKESKEFFPIDVYTKLIYASFDELTIESNGDIFTLKKGETLLIPPFASAEISVFPNTDNKFSLFTFSLPESISFIPDMFTPLLYSHESDLSKALSKYLALPENTSPTDDLLKKSIEFFILYFTSSAMENSKITIPEKLIPAITYIENNYWQNISVADIAKISNISESAMYKLFVSSLSDSPTQYIKKRRMYHASMLLLNSDKSISDIAIETGFYDPFYFSKEFKKEYGISPSTFRKENRDSK